MASPSEKTPTKASSRRKADKPPEPPVGSPDVQYLAELDGAYEIELVDRRTIKDWPFNPRYMDAEAKDKLRGGLAAVKFLGPIVTINRTNGQLIRGHQRLDAVDKIMGTAAYKLRACFVTKNEDEHVEAAILDNNPAAQGDWLIKELGDLVKRPKVRAAAAGFSVADVYNNFGATSMKASDDAMALSAAMQKAEERITAVKKMAESRYEPDFYTVFVFPSEEERAAAMDLFACDQSIFQDGVRFFDAFTTAISEEDPALKPRTAFVDGVSFMTAYRQVLHRMVLHPSRPLDDLAVGASRFLVDLIDPSRAKDKAALSDGARGVMLEYARQVIAALTPTE